MEKQTVHISLHHKQLAILIDPDKTNYPGTIHALLEKISILKPDFLFVGGSTVTTEDFGQCVELLKEHSDIPVIIFPGGHHQIHPKADGILFLSLISGRNPDYLIGHQVESAHRLKKLDITVIPTGYLLIDGGKQSSVAYVSQTSPIPADQTSIAVKTALAGEMMGMRAIFLDAGSGALQPVPTTMIRAVKEAIDMPLIVGGGLKNTDEVEAAYQAGADIVVIGNKIEEDIDFLLDLRSVKEANHADKP